MYIRIESGRLRPGRGKWYVSIWMVRRIRREPRENRLRFITASGLIFGRFGIPIGFGFLIQCFHNGFIDTRGIFGDILDNGV